MARVFFAGPWLSVQGLNSYALHQCANMFAAHIKACSIELILQHASTHEWVFQMQFVNAAHQCQIGDVDRFGAIVDAAAAYAHQFGLLLDRKSMRGVYYRFALSNPTLVSSLYKQPTPEGPVLINP